MQKQRSRVTVGGVLSEVQLMLRDDAPSVYKQAHPSSMSTSGTALPALRGTYLEVGAQTRRLDGGVQLQETK